jgi:hypothetical protein
MAIAVDKAAREWVPGDLIEQVSGPQALQVVVQDSGRDPLARVRLVGTWIETGSFPGIDAAIAQVCRDRVEQVDLSRQVSVWQPQQPLQSFHVQIPFLGSRRARFQPPAAVCAPPVRGSALGSRAVSAVRLALLGASSRASGARPCP